MIYSEGLQIIYYHTIKISVVSNIKQIYIFVFNQVKQSRL